jgi:hypothetical protein
LAVCRNVDTATDELKPEIHEAAGDTEAAAARAEAVALRPVGTERSAIECLSSFYRPVP